MEERQRRGGRRERMGLKNEFGDSRRVWSFFSCSCLVGKRQRERERRQRQRWRGGETASDGEIDMME